MKKEINIFCDKHSNLIIGILCVILFSYFAYQVGHEKGEFAVECRNFCSTKVDTEWCYDDSDFLEAREERSDCTDTCKGKYWGTARYDFYMDYTQGDICTKEGFRIKQKKDDGAKFNQVLYGGVR